MGGHPDRDRVKSGGHDLGNQVGLSENQRQRARPEPFCQIPRHRIHGGAEIIQLVDLRDVHDERVKTRAILRFKNTRACDRVQRVGAEPVHGLRREGHEAASSDDRGSGTYGFVCRVCDSHIHPTVASSGGAVRRHVVLGVVRVPGFAILAVSEDCEVVEVGVELVGVAEVVEHGCDLGEGDEGCLLTGFADEVLVVVVEGEVPFAGSVPEVDVVDEADAGELIECAVGGG